MTTLRLVPTTNPRPPVNIGVTLTPKPGAGPGGVPPVAVGGGPISGPVVIPFSGEICKWLVFMLGVGEDDEIEWVLEWYEMDDPDFENAVQFSIDEFDALAPMAAQVVFSEIGGLEWIDIRAEVNGVMYGPVRVECLY
jgi:hypothetical protein